MKKDPKAEETRLLTYIERIKQHMSRTEKPQKVAMFERDIKRTEVQIQRLKQ